MNTFALRLLEVIRRPLWTRASLGEFVSGQPSRVLTIFQSSSLLFSVIASSRRFFQLSALACAVASDASLHADSHSARHSFLSGPLSLHILLRFRTAVRTAGFIHGLGRFGRFTFPTCMVAQLIRMPLYSAIRFLMLTSLLMVSCDSSTAWLNLLQSTFLIFHFASLPLTDWWLTLRAALMSIGMWSERPMPSIRSHMHFLLKSLPQMVMSGALSRWPSILLVRVGSPEFRVVRSSAESQFSMASPRWSVGIFWSQRGA